MGLFDNDDATKDAEIERLRRELQAAKTCIEERKDEKVVLYNKDSKDNGEESSKYVHQAPFFLRAQPGALVCESRITVQDQEYHL